MITEAQASDLRIVQKVAERHPLTTIDLLMQAAIDQVLPGVPLAQIADNVLMEGACMLLQSKAVPTNVKTPRSSEVLQRLMDALALGWGGIEDVIPLGRFLAGVIKDATDLTGIGPEGIESGIIYVIRLDAESAEDIRDQSGSI